MIVWRNIKFLEAFNRFTGTKGSLMQWLMSLVALIGAAATIYQPQVHTALMNHPDAATVIAGLYAILAHLMPSPIATGPAITAATDATQVARDMEEK